MENKQKRKYSQAMAFVVLFGIVSLFSDMTHEGASSIRGAYLTLLGASAGTIARPQSPRRAGKCRGTRSPTGRGKSALARSSRVLSWPLIS